MAREVLHRAAERQAASLQTGNTVLQSLNKLNGIVCQFTSSHNLQLARGKNGDSAGGAHGGAQSGRPNLNG